MHSSPLVEWCKEFVTCKEFVSVSVETHLAIKVFLKYTEPQDMYLIWQHGVFGDEHGITNQETDGNTKEEYKHVFKTVLDQQLFSPAGVLCIQGQLAL